MTENVVTRLVEPYTGKRRNVTMYNFFTSRSLANKLIAKKTILAGSMNKEMREFYPPIRHLHCGAKVLKNDKTM